VSLTLEEAGTVKSRSRCAKCPTTSPEDDITSKPDIMGDVSDRLDQILKLDTLEKDVSGVKETVDSISMRMNTLEEDLTKLKNMVETHDKKLSALTEDVQTCRDSDEEIHQYQRRKNIEISGIPEQDSEDISQILTNIGREVQCDITETDIDIAHRVPSRVPGRPRSIIVRFVRRQKKFELLQRKPRLTASDLGFPGSPKAVFIGHHLTPKQKELLAKAKQRRDILGGEASGYSSYTSFGKVYFKAPNQSRGVEVRSLAHLDQLAPAVPKA